MIPETLADLVRQRASELNAAVAYGVLDESASIRGTLSYHGLYVSALGVADALRERFDERSRILLAFPSGLGFITAFFGCLLARMIAVPIAPPKRNRANERFGAILRDAGPAGVLTTDDWAGLLRTEVQAAGGAAVVLTGAEACPGGVPPEPAGVVSPDDVAYLQYTSGSITAPKGVAITHRNVIANSRIIADVEENDARTVSLTWLPNFHDMGLVEGVLQPLWSGVPGLLLSPAAFLQRPRLWLEAISRHRVTTSGAPNFAYELCAEREPAAGAAPLDLSSWRVAYNGAEPIRHETLRRFLDTFARYGFEERAFYPVYGLAEATLVVTSGTREDLPVRLTIDRERLEHGEAVPAAEDAPGALTVVASGRLLREGDYRTEVVIVESGAAVPDGTVGEVFITGPSVAAGYWNRPEETRAAFGASIQGLPGRTFARTGDLGFVRDGWLFLTGRARDLIISSGRNLYPHDIEWLAATAHESVRPWGCAAFAADADRGGRIVLVCEGKRHRPAAELPAIAEAVRARVSSELEIELYDVVFIRHGSLPRTSSGKVQRLLCRDRWAEGRLEEEFSTRRAAAAAEAAAATSLLEELRALLAGPGTSGPIPDEARVCEYVNDSLHAVRLCHQVERRSGVAVPASWFLGSLTLAALAGRISSCLPAAAPAADRTGATTGEGGMLRLSYGQEALWSLSAVSPGTTAYHLSRVLDVAGPLDVAALRRALDLVAARHAALRTRFAVVDGVPHQAFDSSRTCAWSDEDASGVEEPEIPRYLAARAWAPFDLEHDSPIRFHVIRRSRDRHLVLVAVHHIVADLWSIATLLDDLFGHYEALAAGRWTQLPPVAAGYDGFVAWQRQLRSSPEGRRMSAAWKERLAGAPLETALPLDRPRPPVQTFDGETIAHDLDEGLSARIDRYASRAGTTPFCVMLAAFFVFLHRATGQPAVAVGVPVSGRSREQFAETIGYLANVNVVSSELGRGATFEDVVARTHAQVLAALDAEDYPFALVVEEAAAGRDPRVSPMFQQMFSLESPAKWEGLAPLVAGRSGGLVERSGLELRSFALPQRGAQFDLQARFVRFEGRLLGSWTFNSGLFDEATVRRWAAAYVAMLAGGVSDPGRATGDLPVAADEAGDAEAANVEGGVTHGLAGDAFAVEDGVTLHGLVERQARTTPDRVAVSFGDGCLTYRQLERDAAALARALRRRGVGLEDVVAVLLERSLALPAVLLGILKTGASFAPIATDWPVRRVEEVLADAGAAIAVTDADRVERDPRFVALGDLLDDGARDRTAAVARTPADAAAYVIFTSGTTGRPKGAVNTHRGIVNRVLWMQRAYGLTPADRVLQKTPCTFDVSVWEFFWPLVAGARLVIAPPRVHRDPAALARLIAGRDVTVVHFVPSMLAAFCESADRSSVASVRLTFCSGEALPRSTEAAALGLFPGAVHNLYGPTEAAIDVTAWACVQGDPGATVPIGRPIANVAVRILDAVERPVVPGAAGELYIAGAALARGYAGRPDLTAASFVPDPYGAGGRLYRTGDRARVRGDLAIEFLGRSDLQVKVRGFRVEPAGIEAHLLAHAGIAAAAVVARCDERTGTRLTAYYVSREGGRIDAEALRNWLAERLPDHMIPAFFAALPAMPLLESGKVDRKALLALLPPGRPASAAIAPRTPDESVLADVWRSVLGLASIGVTDRFFDMGGDSLLVVRAAAQARLRGLNATAEAIFRYQTIERICAQLAGEAPAPAAAYEPFSLIDPADRPRVPAGVVDAMPLARLQEAMVYHIENSANYIAYVATVHLRARFRLELWQQAVDAALARHPYLRVSFALDGFREPLQLVHRSVTRPLDVEDLRHLAAAEQDEYLSRWLAAEKKRRFSWDVPPLVRLALHRRTDETFQLTLTEVTLDGWSIAVLLSELCRAYRALLRGEPVPDEPSDPPYARFVELERRAAADPDAAAAWRRMLAAADAGALPRWPRAWRSADATQHARHTVTVPPPLVRALEARAREAGVPFKSVCLAAHLAVLRTLTGRDDVLTELITHGRPDEPGGDAAVGLYTNTVPVAASVAGLRWQDLVQRASQLEVEIYPLRRYPFADIHRASRDPLLHEAAFNFTHFHVYADLLEGDRDLEVLDVRAFDQTYFALTAYFNLSPGDRGLSIDLDYNPTELAREQVAAAGGYYERALRAIAASPDAIVTGTPLLSAAERDRELSEWSATPAARRQPPDVLDVFHAHCRSCADRLAIVHDGAAVTYGELRRRAAGLARRLRTFGVGPEVGVGVLSDRSPDFVAALLAVLECGGFFVPLDPCDPAERRAALVRAAALRVVVLGGAHVPVSDAVPHVRCAEAGADGAPAARVRRQTLPDALAYCIFTSGSTGTPKGVEVSRRALASFVDAASVSYPFDATDRVLQFAALAFDAALEEIFCTLCAGGTLVLRAGAALDSFDVFLDTCARDAVTVLDLPTGFWHQLTAFLGERRRPIGIPLRAVILGGEKASARSLAAWRAAVGVGATVHNTYGPTEATIVALRHSIGAADPLEDAVPIGRPLPGVAACVLGAAGDIGPVGCAGELCLGGRGLARGYRASADRTAERFRPNPLGPEPGSRLYLTGDIARRRPDGALDFVGRRDDQVKVRGFRVELGEIESALEADPRVAQAAALARTPGEEGQGPAQLVAYVAPEGRAAGGRSLGAELLDRLRRGLPEYMVPSRVDVVPSLPLTPAGKVDKARLAAMPSREAFPERAAPSPARGPAEETLCAIYRGCLGVDDVPVTARFAELGGDSLSAMRIVSRVQERLGVGLTVRDVFDAPSVAALAERVTIARQQRAGVALSGAPALRREPERPLEMSLAQERLWFLHQFDRANTSYNVPAAFRIRGRLHLDALRQAFLGICGRHEVLRTRFVDRGASPGAVLPPRFLLPLRHVDLRSLREDAREAAALAVARREAARPFDLEHDELVRLACIELDDEEALLVVVMHHIVTDEWCADIFVDELRALYEAAIEGVPPRLPDVPVQYSDFARWQKAAVSGARLETLREFWQRELDGAPPLLQLPLDVPREHAGPSRGMRHYFDIEPAVASGLRALGQRHDASLFMVLLSVCHLWLRGATGMPDVVVGSPVTGRTAPETERMLGFFANLLVLRARMRDDRPFSAHLARVRDTALACYDHQALSFAQLVSLLNPERSALYSPIVQVIFGLWPQAAREACIGGLKLRPERIHSGQAKYDLEMQIADGGGALHGFLEYNAALFRQDTIADLVAGYRRLCEAAVRHPGATLLDLALEGAAPELTGAP